MLNIRILFLLLIILNIQQTFSQLNQHNESLKSSIESESCKVPSDEDANCHKIAGLEVRKQEAVKKQHDMKDIKWRWKYVDEQMKGTPLTRPEESIDRRLSNIKRVVALNAMIYTDIYTFSRDPELSRKLELDAAQIDGVDDDLCGQQLSKILSLMKEMEEFNEERRENRNSSRIIEEKHLRLAHVLDSNGKYAAGIMAGRARFVGSHSQCIDSQLILSEDNTSLTDMRVCMAKLRTDKHVDPHLLQLHEDQDQPDTFFSVAICVPKSCHTKSFHKHKNLFKQLVESQFKLPKSIYIDENLELDSIFCLLDDSPLAKIPTSGHLLILFSVVWLSLVVYATFFKEHQIRFLTPRQQHMLGSLDLKASWSGFIGENDRKSLKPNRVNLDILNTLKVIFSIIIVIGHVIFLLSYGVENPLHRYKQAEEIHHVAFFTSVSMVVDSFFIITGIIMARTTFRAIKSPAEGENMMKWFARKSYELASYRYLRLVPLYFLLFWFKKSIFIFMGSGPMWDYGHNNVTLFGSCRAESWSTPMTARAAFIPNSRQCIPQAWSVANDIFYSITLAPLLVLMTIKPRATAIIAIILCIASNLTMFSGFVSADLEAQVALQNMRFHGLTRVFNDLSFLYTSPYNRMFSVLIGIIAGFILHHYEQNEKLKEWPSWFKGIVTKVSIIIYVIVVMAPFIISINRSSLLNQDHIPEFNLAVGTFFVTMNRLNYAVSNAVLLLRLVTDWKDSFLVKNLTGQFWNTMVSLNYTILLLHIDILIFNVINGKSIVMFTNYKIWSSFCAVYLTSCLLGTFLHVFFESPMDKLIRKVLLNTGKVISKETTEHKKSA